jgi:hypothetical protein
MGDLTGRGLGGARLSAGHLTAESEKERLVQYIGRVGFEPTRGITPADFKSAASAFSPPPHMRSYRPPSPTYGLFQQISVDGFFESNASILYHYQPQSNGVVSESEGH